MVLLCILVLKLVKLAKGVRSLLDTLFEALPQVCYISNICNVDGMQWGWGGFVRKRSGFVRKG